MALVLTPAMALAQDLVPSFDLLNTRLKPGDTIWVTDASGREVESRVATLAPSSLTLGSDQAARTLQADDVRRVQMRQRNSLVNSTLIGFAVGAVAGAALGLPSSGFTNQSAAREAVDGALGLGAAGAGTGLLVDVLMPGKKRDVYRAPGAGPVARLSLAPIVTARLV
jgi:hypothetical protein